MVYKLNEELLYEQSNIKGLHVHVPVPLVVTLYRSQIATPDMFKNPASNGACKDIDICINR